MKKQLFVILALSVGSLAQARVAVVSDIDDTIKVSHILDKSDSAKKLLRTDNLFRGMNVLYQEIARRNPGTLFYYVSNAPKKVAGLKTPMEQSHRKFLTQNKFPNGILALRESLSVTTHKVDTIRRVLRNPEIKFVIFVGDNGEHDPEVYAQMRKEFPTIPAITYIRQAYSVRTDHNDDIGQSLKPGQFGFMTPIEISMALAQIGILTPSQVSQIEAQYIPATVRLASNEDRNGNNGILSFPRWIDCRDFNIPDSLKSQGIMKSSLLRRLLQRCSIPAIED